MTTRERPDARRATLHALVGLPLGVGACTVLAGVVVVWYAAIWSLVDGPTGAPVLAVVYVVVAVASPLPLLWCVRGFGAVQRARFRAVLGVEIPAPGEAGDWPLRPVRSWRAPPTWRQLAYHLLALVVGTAGGALVAACWSGTAFAVAYAAGAWGEGPRPAAGVAAVVLALALLPAAPWVALGMARANLADAPEPAREAIEQAHDEATKALAELRDFVRGLHPAVLDDRGLDAALSGIAARAPFPVRLRVDVPRRCSPSIEAVAYFVVPEAPTNLAQHAQARHAEVRV